MCQEFPSNSMTKQPEDSFHLADDQRGQQGVNANGRDVFLLVLMDTWIRGRVYICQRLVSVCAPKAWITIIGSRENEQKYVNNWFQYVPQSLEIVEGRTSKICHVNYWFQYVVQKLGDQQSCLNLSEQIKSIHMSTILLSVVQPSNLENKQRFSNLSKGRRARICQLLVSVSIPKAWKQANNLICRREDKHVSYVMSATGFSKHPTSWETNQFSPIPHSIPIPSGSRSDRTRTERGELLALLRTEQAR